MQLETERLILREYTMADLDALYPILSDAESMQYYPAPFSYPKCRRWIQWNLENYRQYGFGLWAVILKRDGAFLGDCGITMQQVGGQPVPEIGFHIHKSHTRNGYASEAARACRDYAFDVLHFPMVCCCQKYTNIPSQKTAEKLGMKLIETYPDENNDFTTVYAITRQDYQLLTAPGCRP